MLVDSGKVMAARWKVAAAAPPACRIRPNMVKELMPDGNDEHAGEHGRVAHSHPTPSGRA